MTVMGVMSKFANMGEQKMNKKKILVIDDEEDICCTIKQYLELHHYQGSSPRAVLD